MTDRTDFPITRRDVTWCRPMLEKDDTVRWPFPVSEIRELLSQHDWLDQEMRLWKDLADWLAVGAILSP